MVKNIAFECIFLLGLLLYVLGDSYGHVGTVSSPNHTFFFGKLEQAFNQYFVHILSLVTATLLEWISGREENDHRN